MDRFTLIVGLCANVCLVTILCNGYANALPAVEIDSSEEESMGTTTESPFATILQLLLATRLEKNETDTEISIEETILDGHLKVQIHGTENDKEVVLSKRSCLPYGAVCSNGYCCVDEGLKCETNSRGRGRRTNICRHSF